MTKYLLTIALLVTSIFYAQESTYEFAKVSSDIVKMQVYENDPEAEAVIIYERGDAEIRDMHEGLKLEYKYKARVKILKKNGFEKATYEIPLYTNDNKTAREELVSMKAVSYNNYSPLVFIDKKDVYYEDYNENYKIAKFTIPQVKEGTVFDVEYTTTSPFFLHNFQTWKFQSDIPKIHSEYHTKIPANYRYNAKIVGSLKIDDHTLDVDKNCIKVGTGSADCEVNVFKMYNIPAFKEEDYMTSKNNYLSQINYEILKTESFTGIVTNYSKTWDDVDKEIKKSFDLGKQARKERAFEKLIPEHINSMPQDIEKAKAIYYYIQNRMNWNGYNYIFSDVDTKKAFEEQKGNVAEINLALLNMLKASGFEAYMLLVREREDGVPTQLYPVLTEFNYLVVKLIIEDKVYFLDATDKYLPFSLLPLKALNSYGRVINFDDKSYWDNIYISSSSVKNVFLQYNIDSEGFITTKVMENNNGYNAKNKRATLQKKGEHNYIAQLEEAWSKENNAIVSNYKTYNLDKPESDLKEMYEIAFEDEFLSNQILFNPVEGMLFTENPFKLKQRNYPVDFGYPRAYIYKTLVVLDDSYTVKSLPENQTYNYKNLLTLDYATSVSNNRISVQIDFRINKSVFEPEEYQELKNIFNKVVQISNNSDILIEKQ